MKTFLGRCLNLIKYSTVFYFIDGCKVSFIGLPLAAKWFDTFRCLFGANNACSARKLWGYFFAKKSCFLLLACKNWNKMLKIRFKWHKLKFLETDLRSIRTSRKDGTVQRYSCHHIKWRRHKPFFQAFYDCSYCKSVKYRLNRKVFNNLDRYIDLHERATSRRGKRSVSYNTWS